MKSTIACVSCGGVTKLTREDRPYGDGLNVTIKGQEVRRCPDCGEEEALFPAIAQMHEVLADALVRKLGRLTPAEIRFLRTYLGYSSQDFADVMAVRLETVSRWERGDGRYPMKRSNERSLRFLVLAADRIKSYGVAETGREKVKDSPVCLERSRGEWQPVALPG